MQTNIYCRVAPSLGGLEADENPLNVPGHTLVWGTTDYNGNRHYKQPTVFFGMYDLRDYIALWRHKGTAWILWAGADIENLKAGFIFNDGKLHTLSKLFGGVFTSLIMHILQKAEHWVESDMERKSLKKLGITAQVAPSFMGDMRDFPISYKRFHNPNVYVSGHPGREDEYGFEQVKRIAPRCPNIRFHLFGSMPQWITYPKNITLHGKVSKAEFNRQIKTMQCGLRLNQSDGFSEITAKSILMGQYPITRLDYPMIPSFQTDYELLSLLNSLVELQKPNWEARNYYVNNLNRYPWVVK